MIANKLQYKIVLNAINSLKKAIIPAPENSWYAGVHPDILQAEREAMESQLANLQAELAEYYRRRVET